MKFRRGTAAVLAAATALSSVSIVAYAEEDKTMKTELTYVKERITVPKELNDFTHSSRKLNGSTSYTFNWKNNETGEKISATIAGKVITSVYYNLDTDWEWKASFAKLSEEELMKKAKSYVEKINPTINKYVEFDDNISISLYDKAATLNFNRVYNGVPVKGQSGSIRIDKNTGELISYTFNWIRGAGFKSPKSAISSEAAQASFKKEFPVEMKYTVEYDWATRSYTPHLIYFQTEIGQIDAFTGELSTYEKSYSNYDTITDDDEDDCVEEELADEAPMSAAGSVNKVEFTDEEKKKLEEEGKLIKAEFALENLKKMGVFLVPSDCEVTSQRSFYDERTESYFREVGFSQPDVSYTDLSEDYTIPVFSLIKEKEENVKIGKSVIRGNFTINAETGEIRNFYCYGYNQNGTSLKQAATEKKAEEFANVIVGNKRSLFGKLKEDIVHTIENSDKKKINTSISYSAQREANGIKSDFENFYFTVSNLGYITSYRINEYGIQYPEPKNIISASKAYKQYFKQVDYALQYRCAYRSDTKQVVTALVYDAADKLYIDAFTGKLTNSSGRIIEKAESVGGYTDIENSAYKTYAEKLASYGITLMDSKNRLNENDNVTPTDFINLLNNIGLWVNSNDYKDSKTVTRQTAAKMMVVSMYGDELAKLSSIFRTPYSDVKSSSKYNGYIAIADAVGLIRGENGKFLPTKKITRGAALKLVYDYIANNSK